MNGSQSCLVFRLDGRGFALPLSRVARIVRAVEITPLPDASPGILGMVNVEGRILPVLSLRERFGLPPREVHVEDRMILVRHVDREVIVLADAVEGVEILNPPLPAEVLPAGMDSTHQIAPREDGTVTFPDLGVFALPTVAGMESAWKKTGSQGNG